MNSGFALTAIEQLANATIHHQWNDYSFAPIISAISSFKSSLRATLLSKI